jgi:hypothetical protein
MRPSFTLISRPCGLGLLLLLGACATASFEQNVYRDSQTTYRIGLLDGRWHRFDLSGADLAFRDDTGGSIVTNALCEGIKDVSLDVLTHQALMGLEQTKEIERQELTLDGRSALRTHLSASLDGVPVELELVVTKKDGCTYDFMLVAGSQAFAPLVPAFWQLVQGFHQLPRGS